MPRMLSVFGIPLPKWDVLLSRHQLGATGLTVTRELADWKGFGLLRSEWSRTHDENQERELMDGNGLGVLGSVAIELAIW